ncbi:MAG: alpha-E domain-containing protein [Candidatus Binatus sp.]|uniref:alpha-E domain-containing protein n=1 Tax=Candidatus Binatus sp. TaxID=2811406 RepID=UPI00271AFBFF|nr:alpha-E domain-containing protein [Candidatus Binatus sp.]MDO8433873.1 alpha-E domain-containing protein [Candidatus Binatus sp.]
MLFGATPRDAQPWAPLLAIFGETESFKTRYADADESSVLNFFTLDPDNPSSIRNCIRNARANSLSLRHYISSELWLDLNTLYLAAEEWTPELFTSPGVFAFFAVLKDCFYRIAGIRQSTTPRDLAYDFMQLGIMLERAECVARMLDVKYHFLLPRLEDASADRSICCNGRPCCAAPRRSRRIASATATRFESRT